MQEKFYKYAHLILTKGLCINQNQPLLINAPIEAIEFVRVLTEVACELNIRDIYYRISNSTNIRSNWIFCNNASHRTQKRRVPTHSLYTFIYLLHRVFSTSCTLNCTH